MSRRELELRQQDVLDALLRGQVPAGFDPRSAALTSSVLRSKRRNDALSAVPDLERVADLRERFDAWASRHPRRGCPHDDVLDFLLDDAGPVPEPLASVRAVERVYRRQASIGRDRRPGHRRYVVAVGGRVWHLGPRQGLPFPS
ncbi:MAG: hypothetical protein ABW075_06015 [Aeromicrobium sp.]